MKHNHPINMLLAVFAILMVGTCVLYAAGREMIFYKQSVSQKSIITGVESLSEAAMQVSENFSDIAKAEIDKKYTDYKKLADNSTRNPLKESELQRYFREAVIAGFLNQIGGENNIAAYINEILPTPKSGKLYVDEKSVPYMYIGRNENGDILSATVKDVVLVYDGVPGITRREKVRFDILLPEAFFYGGDERLFDFSMIAGKGIYTTGATSSFVGDIYAGPHQAMESRELEIAYGEIGSYGGINFLSTQVGIEAKRIISEADINLNGSFVIFNPEEDEKLICYADKIRKMRGYSQDSMYSITGDFFERDSMSEDAMKDYMEYRTLAENSLMGIAEIPYYYDSDNDDDYTGEYRKIVSSQDVEIKDDYAGIIFTPGTVIVGAGVNFEGLIMCGDRIYLQGNNNIVSNSKIVKKIISDELGEGDIYMDMEHPVYHAIDYMGGFTIPGLRDQNVYVIPYQE